jgi:DNA polymerase-3 subunit gamma/tau
MSYLVLARKYRPKDFNSMVGQTHVLQTLTHALDHQRLHHAYLFTGTRGVGKTSLARILAKCLNCEKGITSNPCNTCSSCEGIDQGRHFDVIEIDAASNTKVEDTRNLLDKVQYKPQQARFKIYIIDEVHMLSGHSFNALLKTLEEPPPYVKFILATTDPQKLPVTILSRCLQFHLKNMSVAQIISQSEFILTTENISYEAPGLALIAENAEGSMRDALSLLDQAISYGSGTLTEQGVSAMLGVVSEAKITQLLDYVHENNQDAFLTMIDHFDENGASFSRLLDALSSLLIKLALNKEKYPPELIQLYYQISIMGKKDLPFAPDPKSGFIMTMLRMAAFKPTSSEGTPPSTSNTVSKQMPGMPSPPTETKKSGTLPSNWQDIVAQLKLSGMTQLLAQNCSILKQTTDQLDLVLDESHSAFLTPASKERLIQAIKDFYETPCQITLSIGKSSTETPYQQTTRENAEKTKAAESALFADKNVQALVQTFSAELMTKPTIEE